MQYQKTIALKNGKTCCLRNGTAQDGLAACDTFCLTHEETDHLLTYPEENRMDAAQEGRQRRGNLWCALPGGAGADGERKEQRWQ